MRILHILDHSVPLHSGYTFRTLAILREQRALGLETEHLTGPKHAGATNAVEEVEGLRFHRTLVQPTLTDHVPALNQIAVIRQLESRILEVADDARSDILHAHSPALNGAAALRAARRLGLPVVYEMRASWEDAAVDHGTTREGSLRYRLGRALESWVLRRADAVTTISEGLREEIIGRGIPAEKVTLIPNAVDVRRFSSEARPGDLGLRERLGLLDATVLGFVGSFYAYEGLALLLEALPAILPHVPEARVLLVGGGYQEQALKRQAEVSGIAERVVFTGRVPHEEVESYYDLIDVLVYPRLSMRLTEMVTPLKPLEAMARSRLVVASDVGGHRELIEDEVNGMLFAAGDVQALARTVVKLIELPGLQKQLRERGRRFVEEQRNWPAVVARYAPVYERLLGRGR